MTAYVLWNVTNIYLSLDDNEQEKVTKETIDIWDSTISKNIFVEKIKEDFESKKAFILKKLGFD